MDPLFIHFNPFHNLTPCLCKMHFNTILQYTLSSSIDLFSNYGYNLL